jgi:hypothetical protein
VASGALTVVFAALALEALSEEKFVLMANMPVALAEATAGARPCYWLMQRCRHELSSICCPAGCPPTPRIDFHLEDSLVALLLCR